MSVEQSLNIILSCSNCGKDDLLIVLKNNEGVYSLFVACADEKCRERQRQEIIAKNPGETEDFIPVLQTFTLCQEEAETLLNKANEQKLN